MKSTHNFNKLLAILAPFQRGAIFPAPAGEAAVLELQRSIPYPLPLALIHMYGVCDGGPTLTCDRLAENLFYSYRLLSVSELLSTHAHLRNICRDHGMDFPRDPVPSIPPGSVQDLLISDAWIPFADDGAGGNLAIDYAPGPCGISGQIINFGRDEPVHFQLAADFDEFLERVVHDYEAKKHHHVFGDSRLYPDRLLEQHRNGGSD
jgi:internalin A